jgi:hypothetical protein
MSIDMLGNFLFWCLMINIGLYMFWVLLFIAGRGVFKIHEKLFHITDVQINVIVYSFLGAYKILLIFFILIPYIALQIIK